MSIFGRGFNGWRTRVAAGAALLAALAAGDYWWEHQPEQVRERTEKEIAGSEAAIREMQAELIELAARCESDRAEFGADFADASCKLNATIADLNQRLIAERLQRIDQLRAALGR